MARFVLTDGVKSNVSLYLGVAESVLAMTLPTVFEI